MGDMTTFNALAKDYDKWYSTPLGKFVDEVESKLAFETVTLKPGMKVLDVGCGTGIYSKRLVERGCLVTGVDISDEMLDIARKKVPEAKFVNTSVYAVPFPKDHFDLIFSMATFEFIHHASAAYFEMKRVARPGAQIFVGTINGDSSWGELYKSFSSQEGNVFKDAHFKEPKDLEEIDKPCQISSAGCVYFKPDTPHDMLTWEMENKLSESERPAFITTLWEKAE